MPPMNELAITPLHGPVRAQVAVPGSKSITNRAMILAALAEGETTLHNALFSDDSLYLAEALRQLGFEVREFREQATIKIKGQGGVIPHASATLYCGNAGTAVRFLAPLLALGYGSYTLDGDARMRERPFEPLATALRQLGADLETSPGGHLPVIVRAGGLRGGKAEVSGHISSQFLSGLLLSAPYARTPVVLQLTSPLASLPYVEMTLAMMAQFQVQAEMENERFTVQNARYRSPGSYAIEPDASGASYFLAIPALCGGELTVTGLQRTSLQGDLRFADILEQMGCSVSFSPSGLTVRGAANGLGGVDVDMRDFSDTAQTLAAIAPFARSRTTIRGIASSRGKETDRVRAMCTELQRLGVTVEEHSDGLTVHPAETIKPALVHTYADHRMAMAFTLVGLRSPGIRIADPACVSKTFPEFFEVLADVRRQSEGMA